MNVAVWSVPSFSCSWNWRQVPAQLSIVFQP